MNAYGTSKLAAEHAALVLPHSTVMRLSLVYGPATPRGGHKTSTFLQFMDASLGSSSAAPLQLFCDEIRCPIAIADVCDACCRMVTLCHDGAEHLQPFLQQRMHCGGPAALSRVAMGEVVCRLRGYSFSDRVRSVTREAAMAEAAFKFASPPDISMKGHLFTRLLQVNARANGRIKTKPQTSSKTNSEPLLNTARLFCGSAKLFSTSPCDGHELSRARHDDADL